MRREDRSWPAPGPIFRLRLVEPERVEPDDVVNAEIIFWVVALYVIVPDVVDLLPRDRQYWRVLLHDDLGLAHEVLAFIGIDLAVDLVDESVELFVVPEPVILRPAGAVPGVEVIRRVQQGRDDRTDRQIEMAVLGVVEPYGLDDGAQVALNIQSFLQHRLNRLRP